MDTQFISEIQGLVSPVPYASSLESTGVSILVAIALLSFLAAFGLLLTIGISVVNTTKSSDRYLFIRSHVFAYFLSLMVCWMVQCIGSALSIQWLQDRAISFGGLCVAQGILKHTADVGIAVWTTVIACHTFCVLFLDLRMSKYGLLLVLTFGWILTFLLVASGPLFAVTQEKGPFYSITGHWCWISPAYELQRILLAYVVMFSGAALSTILYILTFLRLRGTVVRDGWKHSPHQVGSDSSNQYPASDKAQLAAKQMLLYPFTYALLLTPIVIVQIVRWSGNGVSFEWAVFSNSVYLLSGLVNVILFASSRRILPSESLRLGNWYLIPNSRGPSSRSGASPEDAAEKGASKAVTFAAQPTILCTPPGRREAKRPPALALDERRDSMDSMYSLREGVYIPPLSSHWSPDTPPLQKVSRLSAYLENVTVIAQKI